MMRELAEATARFGRLSVGEERVERDGFDIFLAPGNSACSNVVQRPRFDSAGIETTVE